MIATWEEINSRYDAIKDHKPRAAKKLKELGEVLASAYKLDPQRADEMWQYIIELNIKDNIAYSKFYIAQVFNKLTMNLPYNEAVEYVSMRPERVRLMFLYGYDGGTLNRCAYAVIGRQVLDGKIDEAMETLSMLEEKFANQEGMDRFALYSVYNYLCTTMEETPDQLVYNNRFRYDIPTDRLLTFLDTSAASFDDEYIRAVAKAHSVLLSGVALDEDESKKTVLFLSEAASQGDNVLNNLFFSFLYRMRNLFGDEIEDILYNYSTKAGTIRIPLVYYGEDELQEEASVWYQSVVSDSERIIEILFEKQPCRSFLKSQIKSYMYNGDWRAFSKYLVAGLNQEGEYVPESYLEFLKEEIQSYLSYKGKKIEFENGQWWISQNEEGSWRSTIEKPRITENNINDFIHSLAMACLLTSDSRVNEQLVDAVRSFVSKETGNVDALNAMGMELEADNRSELEKFRDYAEKESVRRPKYNIDYSQRETEFIRNIQRETGTYGVDTGRLLAKHPQIISFLFLHDAHSFSAKDDIILGALLNDDYSTALKCVDYMIETANYPNFADRNSWSMEMTNTIKFLIRKVYSKQSSSYEEPYPESIISAVIQIAEKTLTFLGGDDAREVKAELLRIRPADDDRAEFILQLMEDVDAYTAEKKPKGYAKRINNITSAISNGIDFLAKQGRLDVIAQILRKITDGRQYIEGPSYDSWMTNFNKLEKGQAIELFHLIPEVYTKYIEVSDQKMALKLLLAVGQLGDMEVYETLKKQIIQKHGYIDGMASCYRHSEETAKPILLVDNRVFKASLLYWNTSATVRNQFNVLGVDIIIRIENKHKEYISMYASDVAVNGIQLSKLRKQQGREQPEREHISYYIGSGEVATGELRLYWSINREPQFKEVSEVTFTMIAQCDDKDISKDGPFKIKYDPMKDIYEVLKTR